MMNITALNHISMMNDLQSMSARNLAATRVLLPESPSQLGTGPKNLGRRQPRPQNLVGRVVLNAPGPVPKISFHNHIPRHYSTTFTPPKGSDPNAAILAAARLHRREGPQHDARAVGDDDRLRRRHVRGLALALAVRSMAPHEAHLDQTGRRECPAAPFFPEQASPFTGCQSSWPAFRDAS